MSCGIIWGIAGNFGLETVVVGGGGNNHMYHIYLRETLEFYNVN